VAEDDRVRAATEPAVTAFVAAMRGLFGALPEGEWTERPGLVTYATSLMVPRFNGAVLLGPDADEAAAAAWLDELAFRGLPFALLSRPAAPAWVAPLAATYGLTHVAQEPMMVHVDPDRVREPLATGSLAGLTVDVVDGADPEQVRTGQQLLADGFEVSVELVGPVMAAEVVSLPGVRAYVGRTGGVPCCAGLGSVDDGHIGVFNIATPPALRRRGFGGAVTARVVADGVLAGAHTAYLQASTMGYPVYERMGFRTAETWPCFYPG